MTFWKSRYAAGARLIAVPGCPFPTFSTASAASILAVSTALLSTESHCRAATELLTLLREKRMPIDHEGARMDGLTAIVVGPAGSDAATGIRGLASLIGWQARVKYRECTSRITGRLQFASSPPNGVRDDSAALGRSGVSPVARLAGAIGT
ncbi:hypothetical protein ACFFGH_31685 [Lysobacter korlensis]|uniref:Uncharacterized protein n=1 Tax=Lysobacter korlensis TaxID=553636 RepID=A0ABV6RZK8_9GAMM